MAINFNEELIRVEYVIDEDSMTETVSGELQVPDVKPDIGRIVDVRANLDGVTTNIEDEGVEVTGSIEVGVVYVAAEEDQPVHFFQDTLDFTNFFDFPEAEAGMNVFADVNIRRVSFVQVEPPVPEDPDDPEAPLVGARTAEVTVVIHKFVKVTEYRQITVITDVSGIPEENITEELLRIEDVIGENTISSVVTGEISPPAVKPDIERVLNVTAEIIEVNSEITDEGVIIDGTIEAGVIYVASTVEGDQPVHFFEGEINFTETVDVPGAEEGLSVFTDVSIKKVTYDFIEGTPEPGDESVEVDVVLQLFAKVTEPKQVNVITDVISDQVEVERDLLRVEDVVGEDVVHETVTDRLNVTALGKPLVDRIIEPQARIEEYTATTEEGGVYIEGNIEATVLYVAAEVGQPVHFAETMEGNFFNFDNFVNVPGTEPGMNTHTEVEVTKVSAEKRDCERIDGELTNCETIEFDIVIRKFAKVTEFRQLEIVTDIIVVSPVADGECPPSYVVYVVQPGDTLYKISRRYRTTVDELIQANPGIDPHNLQIGQKICVPSGIMKPKG